MHGQTFKTPSLKYWKDRPMLLREVPPCLFSLSSLQAYKVCRERVFYSRFNLPARIISLKFTNFLNDKIIKVKVYEIYTCYIMKEWDFEEKSGEKTWRCECCECFTYTYLGCEGGKRLATEMLRHLKKNSGGMRREVKF